MKRTAKYLPGPRLPAKSAMWALLGIVIAVCSTPGLATAAEDKVGAYLDHIDSKLFVDGVVEPMSGSAGVKDAAMDSGEIRYLVQHPSESIPAMLSRLHSPGGLRYERTKILYFIVFEKAKDTRTIPALADYLDSAAPSDEPHAMNGSPFEYAFWASCAFLDFAAIRQKYKSPSAIFRARHEIANQLRVRMHQPGP